MSNNTICFASLFLALIHALPARAQESTRPKPATDFDRAVDSLVLARNYARIGTGGNRFFELAGGTGSEVKADYGTAIKNYRKPEPKDPMGRSHPELYEDAITTALGLFTRTGSERAKSVVRDASFELCEAETMIANDVLIDLLSTRLPNAKRQSSLPKELQDVKDSDNDGSRFPQAALEYIELHFRKGTDALELLWRYPSLLRAGRGPLDLVQYDTFSDGKGVPDSPDADGYYHFDKQEEHPSELRMAMHAAERMTRSQLTAAKRRFFEAAYGTSKDAQKERAAAQEKFRECSHESYLWLATTAVLHADSATHTKNGAGDLRANLAEAQNGFTEIRLNHNPRRLPDMLVPNHATSDLWALASESVTRAKNTELEARGLSDRYESSLIGLRGELDRQRALFEGPIKDLTGMNFSLDVALKRPDGTREPFDIYVRPGVDEIRALQERKRLLAAIRNRVNNWQIDFYNKTVGPQLSPDQINAEAFPPRTSEGNWPEITSDPANAGGKLGAQLLEIRAATLSALERIENFKNYAKRIDIEKQRAAKNADVVLKKNKEIGAKQIAMGWANSVSLSYSSTGVSVNFSPGSIVSGYLQRDITEIQADIQVTLQNNDSAATILNLLLEQHRSFHEVQMAQTRLVQAHAALQDSLFQLERLITDWANAKTEVSEVYLKFPLTRIERDEAQRTADESFDTAVERCFELVRALEYDWAESYQNPVRAMPEDKALVAEAVRFRRRESLFGVARADDLTKFLIALQDWQKKLKENRGANYPPPRTTRVLSLRELLLGLKSKDAGDEGDDLRFQRWLRQRCVLDDQGNPVGLVVGFSTDNQRQGTTPDRGMLFAINEWNQKITHIGIALYGQEIGTNRRAEIVTGGFTKVRTFPWRMVNGAVDNANLDASKGEVLTFDLRAFAPEISLVRDGFRRQSPLPLTTYQTYSKIRVEPYAKPDFYIDQPPLDDRFPLVSRRIGVMVSDWILVIDLRSDPDNRSLDIGKITDIGIAFRYEFNQPHNQVVGPQP